MTSHQKEKTAQCGICGKSKKLVKTECCGHWVCDLDSSTASHKKNCYYQHSRFTLCGFHNNERHSGRWQNCKECRDSFETEMYVWYGTNELNFEKLENPPEFEPTKCDGCGKIISLSKDGHMRSGDQIFCEDCSAQRFYDNS